MIDLHVHTTASDGQYTPTEILEKAAKKGLSVCAITDHDTIAGLKEGEEAANRLGITFVPGVEINIQNCRGEFHLLGLGLSNVSSSLQRILDNLIISREIRNKEIIKKMQESGVDITLEEIIEEFPGAVIGRPHLAYELVKKGVVKHKQQAFDKYLAKGRPWYCERIGANLDEAIIAIKESQGVPIIAHPMSLYLSWGKLPEAMENYKNLGIIGIEAFHPGARVTECLRLEELGRKLGLIITAGSDFHGEKIRVDRKLGYTCGNKKIEDSYYYDELLPALERHRISF